MFEMPDVNSQTHQAFVAVLEDDKGEAERIQEALEYEGKVVEVFSDVEPFVEYLTTEAPVDVGSIDWSINNASVGSSVLKKIKEHEPVIGKVVYSVHAGELKVQYDAKNNGADFIIEKSLRNIDDYVEKIEEAAQRGLSRRIAIELEKRKVLEFDFGWTVSPMSAELENQLYETSREFVHNELLEKGESKLIDFVKRRGWWTVFNPLRYSELNHLDKLLLLTNYVGINSKDIANILEISDESIKILFTQFESNQLPQEEVFREADNLLSIMAYVLRLSGYEPELMKYFWGKQEEFGGSLTPPPWDSSGLGKYLQEVKKTGIKNSINWIRRY